MFSCETLTSASRCGSSVADQSRSARGFNRWQALLDSWHPSRLSLGNLAAAHKASAFVVGYSTSDCPPSSSDEGMSLPWSCVCCSAQRRRSAPDAARGRRLCAADKSVNVSTTHYTVGCSCVGCEIIRCGEVDGDKTLNIPAPPQPCRNEGNREISSTRCGRSETGVVPHCSVDASVRSAR